MNMYIFCILFTRPVCHSLFYFAFFCCCIIGESVYSYCMIGIQHPSRTVGMACGEHPAKTHKYKKMPI